MKVIYLLLVSILVLNFWKVIAELRRRDKVWTPQLLGNSLFEAGFTPEQFSIRLLTHAWFPGTPRAFGKLPEPLFDVVCQIFAVMTKRRQLLAVARKRSEL